MIASTDYFPNNDMNLPADLNLNSRTVSVEKIGKKTGRFLLFIRCGQKCPLCLTDYFYDNDIVIVISQYQPIEFTVHENFWLIKGGLSKFDSARLFFLEFPDMLHFESFAFFDPDVGISFYDLGALLRAGCSDGKTLYQGAVASDSSTYWEFLKSKQTNTWREVSFVEVMAPIFSKEGLLAVIDCFSDSTSTWGLEYYWYSKLKNFSMAVNDRFLIRHDSPVDITDGPFYRYLSTLGIDPFFELKKLKDASVGNYFVECEIPKIMPLVYKKYYVLVLAYYVRHVEKLRHYFLRLLVRMKRG
ncbi:hypothetical protein ABC383_03400 [Noviherbaspirillum sp. 1P10PC]|uniref:hypothetical protein n=1 Tax=Noviherbaspirillum sp. 1P10PC TaxID=3132292 RepID=UPI00399FABE2